MRQRFRTFAKDGHMDHKGTYCSKKPNRCETKKSTAECCCKMDLLTCTVHNQVARTDIGWKRRWLMAGRGLAEEGTGWQWPPGTWSPWVASGQARRWMVYPTLYSPSTPVQASANLLSWKLYVFLGKYTTLLNCFGVWKQLNLWRVYQCQNEGSSKKQILYYEDNNLIKSFLKQDLNAAQLFE